MKRVTIKDVAELAGVSKSTVSHVINNTRHVEDNTKLRVKRAIDQLDYRPSSIARSLVSKRTKTVGLLVSNVGNPYYPEVIYGVEEIALKHGYQLFLCNTGYDTGRVITIVNSLIEKQVDGVLSLSSSLGDRVIEEITNSQTPVVTVINSLSRRSNLVSTISIDFEVGITQAIDHLVKLGHRRIAHISGPLNLWTAIERRDLFRKALVKNGLDPDEAIVIEGDLRIAGGRKAVGLLLEQTPRPTAAFAANDLMALGVMWEARNRGLRVPEALSVIGLDNIELSAAISPPLTTVAIPRYEIGKFAMNTLMEMINQGDDYQPGESSSAQDLVVDTQLIVRQSTTMPMSIKNNSQ